MKGLLIAALTVVMVAALAMPCLAKKKPVIERFEATSMDIDSGRASIAEIGIMEWSTDEERQALIQAFNDG